MTTNEENTAARKAIQNTEVDTVALFDVLSDSRRRFVVSILEERGGPLSVDEIAAELERWQADEQEDAIPDEQSQELYLELHHVHVPKMVEAGVVEYDEDDDTVSLVDEYDRISSDLDLSTDE